MPKAKRTTRQTWKPKDIAALRKHVARLPYDKELTEETKAGIARLDEAKRISGKH